MAGFGTQFSPELDEEVFADSPQPMTRREPPRYNGGSGIRNGGVPSQVREEPAVKPSDSDVWEGPGQCPTCHAPAGKRHGRQCMAA